MNFRNYKSKKKWQKTFIDDVFSHKTANIDTFSKIIIYNTKLLEDKSNYLPKSLFEFYSPTSDNILDIKKQRLWLSHPKTFNDPFDCHTGYDVDGYEKHILLKYIQEVGCVDVKNSQDGFTVDEFDKLTSSTTSYEYNWYNSRIEEYGTFLRKSLKNKTEDFNQIIRDLINKSRNEVKAKIEILRNVNIRIACFSARERDKDFNDVTQIWSHYADNHKGFCVEYDISPLKEPVCFSVENHEFYREQPKYMEERIMALILGGLFPVIYTANRVNIPKTKLNKIKLDEVSGPNHNIDIHPILYKTFIVKSAKWSYEKEWRLILDEGVCDYYGNKIPFPYIKRIFLGCKMNTQTIDTMIEIAEELGVEVVMMEMCNKKFILEEHGLWSYKWDKERTKERDPFH
jgi:hypothetical protein